MHRFYLKEKFYMAGVHKKRERVDLSFSQNTRYGMLGPV